MVPKCSPLFRYSIIMLYFFIIWMEGFEYDSITLRPIYIDWFCLYYILIRSSIAARCIFSNIFRFQIVVCCYSFSLCVCVCICDIILYMTRPTSASSKQVPVPSSLHSSSTLLIHVFGLWFPVYHPDSTIVRWPQLWRSVSVCSSFHHLARSTLCRMLSLDPFVIDLASPSPCTCWRKDRVARSCASHSCVTWSAKSLSIFPSCTSSFLNLV